MHNAQRIVIFTLIGLLTGFSVFAQKSTSSPYSIYGIGDIYKKGFVQTRSMGGLGTAVRLPNTINYMNPASYTSQDSMSFIFDFSISGRNYTYATSDNEYSTSTYYLDHIALSFPVTRWMSISSGLLPFSSVGYKISSNRQVADVAYNETFEGKGGIDRFYLGAAVKLYNRLSIGINFSYLFGEIKNTINTDFDYSDAYEDQFENTYSINDIWLNTGVQYFDTISSNLSYIVGLTFNTKTKLKTQNKVNRIIQYPNNIKYSLDTFSTSTQDMYVELPLSIGAGFIMDYKNKLLFGFDYTFQNWSDVKTFNSSNYSNTHNIAAGLQVTPDKKALKGYWKKIHYRLGGYYANSYFNVYNQQLNDYGITFGLGLPFKNTKSTFNMGCEIGERGTLNNNLIKESYINWSVSLTLYDFWFFQSKYD